MDTTKQLLNALDPKYILKQEPLPVAQIPKPTNVDKALKISLESTADALKDVSGATAKNPEESERHTNYKPIFNTFGKKESSLKRGKAPTNLDINNSNTSEETNYKPIFNTFGKKESSLKRGKATRKLDINDANTSEEINTVPTTVNPMYKSNRNSQTKSLRTRKRSRFSQSNNNSKSPNFLNTMLSPTNNKHVSFSPNTESNNGNTRGMAKELSPENKNAFNKQTTIERPNIIKKRSISRNKGNKNLLTL